MYAPLGRPIDIVFFGEIPYEMERIEAALALLTARGGTDPDAPPTGPVPPSAGAEPSAPES